MKNVFKMKSQKQLKCGIYNSVGNIKIAISGAEKEH